MPIPLIIGDPEWVGLMDGIARGSKASMEILLERLRETEASVAIAAERARSTLADDRDGDFRRELDAFASRGAQA